MASCVGRRACCLYTLGEALTMSGLLVILLHRMLYGLYIPFEDILIYVLIYRLHLCYVYRIMI